MAQYLERGSSCRALELHTAGNDKTVLRGGYGQSSDPRPFQDVRNAFPIANIWSMPAISFNGVDNCVHSRDYAAAGAD